MNPPIHRELQLPISVKGIALQGGRVLLLKNERSEWELPGGKLERGEGPEDCVAREVEEESGWKVRVGSPVLAWQYEIRPDRTVFVLAYGCEVETQEPPVVSSEHREARLFRVDEVDDLPMPAPYKHAIALWAASADSARE